MYGLPAWKSGKKSAFFAFSPSREIQKRRKKGLFPQIFSDMLKPPSPFAALFLQKLAPFSVVALWVPHALPGPYPWRYFWLLGMALDSAKTPFAKTPLSEAFLGSRMKLWVFLPPCQDFGRKVLSISLRKSGFAKFQVFAPFVGVWNWRCNVNFQNFLVNFQDFLLFFHVRNREKGDFRRGFFRNMYASLGWGVALDSARTRFAKTPFLPETVFGRLGANQHLENPKPPWIRRPGRFS